MPDLYARINQARINLQYATENVLHDLGEVGRAKREEIMEAIGEELDEIAELVGDDDDA